MAAATARIERARAFTAPNREKVLHRGYLSYASTKSSTYREYLDREDQGWASVKVGKPYKPLGEPLLDYKYQQTITKGNNGNRNRMRESEEIIDKPNTSAGQSHTEDDSVRALLQLCNPRRMEGRAESAAIRHRIALSNHRIRTVKTGGRIANTSYEPLERRIAQSDTRLRQPLDWIPSNPHQSSRQKTIQGIRESHKNSPTAQWARFAERTQTRATQSAATLKYFTARGLPVPPAGQILRQVKRGTASDTFTDEDDEVKTKKTKSNPLQTLARCYADFDLTKNDLRERLIESLALMDNNRDALLQSKYHNFIPTFDNPEVDIYDMRDQAELHRHGVVLRRHQNYAWLHLLVQYADKLAHQEGAEMPTMEETEMLHTISDMIDNDDNLDMDFESFRKIVLFLDPAHLHMKEVRLLLANVQKMFDLTPEQYQACLQEAGFTDDDARFRFNTSPRRRRVSPNKPRAPNRRKPTGAMTARTSSRGGRTASGLRGQSPSVPKKQMPKTSRTHTRTPNKQRMVINPDMMQYTLEND